ncbi:hypothetical protein SAMN05444004_106194 [Jannaschia faecimaris]|uniref:DUF4157 domain-containing protein n=1 Tax=Jannaschia faecimaris TaxID=1244108 RepID=A0A1H3QKY7_9RHOB|nr:hypothetical protein [Jannaschia faecimaris]SDZ14047.1 hypothetical protein SAMN05444004_106194 [Jannaschia faecimaris]
MRLALVLLALTSVAACTRPLTPAEMALVAPLHGPTLDTAAARITRAPGVGLFPITFDARPRTTCRERIVPPMTGRITAPTAGIVLFNRLFVSTPAHLPDYAAPFGPDQRLDLPAAMFLVHELTHVWQWQNRDLTGYHPARAFGEQVAMDDPYLFDANTSAPFLSHGYEVQASLVEEYLCCASLDPNGARTDRLKQLLREVMPVAEPEAFARPVWVPHEDDLPNICN